MSDLFIIKAMAAPWAGLNYSVSWDGRGVVSKHQSLTKIWNAAFDSCKQANMVGFSFDKGETIRINASIAYSDQYQSVDYLIHLVSLYGGINGAAFVYREEAEQFVEAMEKHVAWTLLKREYTGEY